VNYNQGRTNKPNIPELDLYEINKEVNNDDFNQSNDLSSILENSDDNEIE
jgi:hypothetical protein